jgi:3-dehydroquinate synthase
MEELQLVVTGYPLLIAPGAIDRVGELARSAAPAHRYAVIADDTTGALYGDRAARGLGDGDVVHVRFAPGEASKTRETWVALTDSLLEAGCGRDTTIIA